MRILAAVVATVIGTSMTVPAVALQAPFEPEAVTVRSCIAYPDAWTGKLSRAPSLESSIAEGLDDPRLVGVGVGLSIWVQGLGEVFAVNPDFRFRPASNQKILTAMGALEYIGADAVLTTRLSSSAPVDDGVLRGDLVLVGSGDPTLASAGTHSLDSLARQVAAMGIGTISGDVLIDESRFDRLRTANGWSGFWIPTWVGSLSAVVVDENRASALAADIAEPALDAGRSLIVALAENGIRVGGEATLGLEPSGAVTLAATSSVPLSDIVGEMVRDSNNMYAETLLKEIGYRHSGLGTSQSGLAAIEELVRSMCFSRSLLQQDGSGLSDGNTRSARQWRRILQSAQRFTWWPDLEQSLAVAGVDGTLERRFVDTEAEANLRGKTGSITGLRALTGTFTTAGGRTVFFSAIVDADEPRPGMAALDDLLVRVAADGS